MSPPALDADGPVDVVFLAGAAAAAIAAVVAAGGRGLQHAFCGLELVLAGEGLEVFDLGPSQRLAGSGDQVALPSTVAIRPDAGLRTEIVLDMLEDDMAANSISRYKILVILVLGWRRHIAYSRREKLNDGGRNSKC